VLQVGGRKCGEAIKTLQRALERAVAAEDSAGAAAAGGSAEQGGVKLEIWKTLEHPNVLELYGASCECP